MWRYISDGRNKKYIVSYYVLSFHIMFYRLYRGVAKYIVSGNTFSSSELLRSLYATTYHEAWRRDRTTSQDTTRSVLMQCIKTRCTRCNFKHYSFKTTDFKPLKLKQQLCAVSFCVRGARLFFFADFKQWHKHTYMCLESLSLQVSS